MSLVFKAKNAFFSTETINAVAGSVNYVDGTSVVFFVSGISDGVEVPLSKSEADYLNSVLADEGFVSTGDWLLVNPSRIAKAEDAYDFSIVFSDGFSMQGGGLGEDDPLYKYLHTSEIVA